uniref:C-type lectin domain-containing protein n=1 Tax=Xiphophorus maculatus TaxID=8083 RepID=A0A3B5R5P9_XIPMA
MVSIKKTHTESKFFRLFKIKQSNSVAKKLTAAVYLSASHLNFLFILTTDENPCVSKAKPRFRSLQVYLQQLYFPPALLHQHCEEFFLCSHCMTDKLILIKEKMNWEDALYYCRDHHHDLVTITNMDQQISVQQEAQFASTDYVWTGLHYTCTLDFWFWVSDEVVIYQNWAKGEPMDDCDMSGAMETGGKHKWFKRNDSDLFNFICSKE